ncbi:hypothetical protein [Duganella sp.]|uniref:hypothetical protein n=1 Tax=Duganella sp. TaxID=1904440 RepID=UPI0031DF45D7
MAAYLSVLIPTQITEPMLTDTTVPETDYGLWDVGTTYPLGGRCMKEHRIYESQIAGNVGKDPADLNNQFGTVVYWLDIGPTNRWALFDNDTSTQTSAVGSMTYVLSAKTFNTIYLGGLQAQHVDIVVKNEPGGDVVFTYSGTLQANRPSDYYAYCFSGFSFLKSKIVSGIPPYATMELTITLSNGASGTVLCGVLAVGLIQKLGRTQQGAKAKPKNFGYVDIDKYGKATIVKGKKATDMSASAKIDSSEAREVQEALQNALQTACMVSCSDSAGYSGLNTFGLVSGEVTYKTDETSEISIDVEGLS